jgi:hypothetical protein
MYYEMHMIEDSQKSKQEKHMFCLPKTGQPGLANRNIGFSQHNQKNQNIRFGKLNYLVFSDISY